jgi:phosphohistidine phosphatase
VVTRRLVVLRHAKSDWDGGEPDHRRPLAARGRREAPAAGRWLCEHVAGIGLAVVSDAVRARQTWDLVAAELDPPPPTQVDPRVYGATADELLGVVRGLPEDVATVLLVGHNPGLEDLVAALTGTAVVLKTSAVAVLTGPGAWATAAAGWGTLETSATPRP